jgi:aminodeoxyfutalosine synthase
MPPVSRSDPLDHVEQKVARGERLSFDDGLALFESPDLLRIGRMADQVRRRKVGDDVYFVVNRHINYTNICRNRCRFCAFSRTADEPGAYTLTVEEVLAKARESIEQGASEIHIVGGEHPALPYADVRAMIAGIRALSETVHIKAFTASEIVHFADGEKVTAEDILRDLKAAGLESMPGGGAEIFAEKVRTEVCPAKISGERWLEVHALAHRLGLKTNATMLYGHIESYEDRVDHFLRLRATQDETGGFQAFIALAFQPAAGTPLADLPGTTGMDDLKTMAAARLLLDNFDHIKTYWVMTGLKDMDGTVVEEVISLLSGAGHGQALSKAELVRVIRDAGRMPVERDGLYRTVRRFDGDGAAALGGADTAGAPAAPGAGAGGAA